jgi:hypothetical protein
MILPLGKKYQADYHPLAQNFAAFTQVGALQVGRVRRLLSAREYGPAISHLQTLEGVELQLYYFHSSPVREMSIQLPLP